MVDTEESTRAIHVLDKLIELGKDGLTRDSEFKAIRTGVIAILNDVDPNSRLGREIERWGRVTRWYPVYTNGFIGPDEVREMMELKEFLLKALEEKGGVIPKQKIIHENRPYDGRKALRELFETAQKSIDLHDNYIGRDIINIIEPYAEKDGFKIRLTTNFKKLKSSEKSDLLSFLAQYPNVEIKNNIVAHGRFFVIDGRKVISSGSSIKDLGKQFDMIGEVEGDVAVEYKQSFEEWWKRGSVLI